MASKNLSMVGHLDEIRKRLIFTLIFFVIIFFIAFMYVEEIYAFLIKDLGTKLAVLGPGEILWAYFTIAGLVSLAITIPLLLYQIWAFVAPALRKKEKHTIGFYFPVLFILFCCGIVFGYFVIMPTLLEFIQNLGSGMFIEVFTMQKYFSFVLTITLQFGILFMMPAISMMLTSIGIITPAILITYRKYAFFILVCISALISPPDFLSQFVVLIPLVFIYEISILTAKFSYRKVVRSSVYESEHTDS